MNFYDKYLSKKSFIGLIKFVFLVCPIFIITRIHKGRHDDVWIICERKSEARDNGYHLFKYIRETHPDIDIFYLITRDSSDLNKVQELGSYIYFGSLKHYFYYFLASKHISSHGRGKGCMPDMHAFTLFETIFSAKAKKIDLKHGITKDYQVALTKEKSGIDLFICGAKPEYDYVQNFFGYSPDEVKYLGFARFDNLHDFKVKNQIMYMPTWRTWLDKMQHHQFVNSDYYQNISKLINDRYLHSFLDQHELVFTFCLHPLMQKYIDLFSVNSDKVIIADTSQHDIQDLLKESKILITDYSSVFFDFAYMKKPIIYYQFDYSEYRAKHFQEGYFDYHRDGFGGVFECERDVVREIEEIAKNYFTLSDTYLQRINKCFTIRDGNNCQRIFDAISEL